MEYNNLELYTFYQEFFKNGLTFNKKGWYYEIDGLKVPVSRTVVDDFARRINYFVKEAKNTIKKTEMIKGVNLNEIDD